MDPDADDVTRLNGRGVQRFQCFVGDDRVAEGAGCSGREHVQPSGGYDADAERQMTWIDQVDAQKRILLYREFRNPRSIAALNGTRKAYAYDTLKGLQKANIISQSHMMLCNLCSRETAFSNETSWLATS
jgi:hypothetical protein